MGDLVNLNRFKKRVAREGSAKEAEANRALFGRTKGERQRDELQKQQATKLLDQHRIDDGSST
ncbi:DUF4169 family protein [Bradyrhizobium sp. SYSU BS000235]|uniref:DUF4169 family protein n=1 Tax=Bradyrhizobium sp. SYSU BS000235 TaxID=3411332 RepID=UPI003C736B61